MHRLKKKSFFNVAIKFVRPIRFKQIWDFFSLLTIGPKNTRSRQVGAVTTVLINADRMATALRSYNIGEPYAFRHRDRSLTSFEQSNLA